MKSVFAIAFTVLSLAFVDAGAAQEKKKGGKPLAAKEIFGNLPNPAKIKPQAFGTYNMGCLAGGKMLPVDGPGWQAMRLSRNRNWGHPQLIDYVQRLANDARRLDGWPGLLVGDLAQPRGGPMLTGHASHQIGLDADIWLLASPGRKLSRAEREKLNSISVVKNRREVDPKVWTDGHAKLLRRAASYPEVARIFVNPPIKKALCKWAKGDRSWLSKIRPWYGHNYHFHVRIKCPKGNRCKNQPAPPAGDGCGANLKWWLSDKPYAKREKLKNPKKPIKYKVVTMAHLPKPCGAVAASK